MRRTASKVQGGQKKGARQACTFSKARLYISDAMVCMLLICGPTKHLRFDFSFITALGAVLHRMQCHCVQSTPHERVSMRGPQGIVQRCSEAKCGSKGKVKHTQVMAQRSS